MPGRNGRQPSQGDAAHEGDSNDVGSGNSGGSTSAHEIHRLPGTRHCEAMHEEKPEEETNHRTYCGKDICAGR